MVDKALYDQAIRIRDKARASGVVPPAAVVQRLMAVIRGYESQSAEPVSGASPLTREAGIAPGSTPVTPAAGMDVLRQNIEETPEETPELDQRSMGASHPAPNPDEGSGGAGGAGPLMTRGAREAASDAQIVADEMAAAGGEDPLAKTNESRSLSRLKSLYTPPRVDVPATEGKPTSALSAFDSDVEPFYEPSLQQFHREHPEFGDASESSLAYRAYADAAYKKRAEEATRSGKAIVRNTYEDLPRSSVYRKAVSVPVGVDKFALGGLGGAALSAAGAPIEKYRSIAEGDPVGEGIGAGVGLYLNPLGRLLGPLAGRAATEATMTPIGAHFPTATKALVGAARGALEGGAIGGANSVSEDVITHRPVDTGAAAKSAALGGAVGGVLGGATDYLGTKSAEAGDALRAEKGLGYLEKQKQARSGFLSGVKPSGEAEAVEREAAAKGPGVTPRLYVADKAFNGPLGVEQTEIAKTLAEQRETTRLEQILASRTKNKRVEFAQVARAAQDAHKNLRMPGYDRELVEADQPAEKLRKVIDRLVAYVEPVNEAEAAGLALAKKLPPPGPSGAEFKKKFGYQWFQRKDYEQWWGPQAAAKGVPDKAEIASARKLLRQPTGPDKPSVMAQMDSWEGKDRLVQEGEFPELDAHVAKYGRPPGASLAAAPMSASEQKAYEAMAAEDVKRQALRAPAGAATTPGKNARPARKPKPTGDDYDEVTREEASERGVPLERGVARWYRANHPEMSEEDALANARDFLASPAASKFRVKYVKLSPGTSEKQIRAVENAVRHAVREGGEALGANELKSLEPAVLDVRRKYPSITVRDNEGGLILGPNFPSALVDNPLTGKQLQLRRYAALKRNQSQRIGASNRGHALLKGPERSWEGPLTEPERGNVIRQIARYGDEGLLPEETAAIEEHLGRTVSGPTALRQIGTLGKIDALRNLVRLRGSAPITKEGVGSGRLMTIGDRALRYRMDPILESFSGVPREGAEDLFRYSKNNPLRLSGGAKGASAGAIAANEEQERHPGRGPSAHIPPALILPILRSLLLDSTGQTPTP